jgi:hypothetical protein
VHELRGLKLFGERLETTLGLQVLGSIHQLDRKFEIGCGVQRVIEAGVVNMEILPNLKASKKSIEINKLSIEGRSWKELSDLYYSALNILTISSMPIGKELMGI